MDISVVIPCHNNAPWVGEALRSVAAQTLQPREIILVDDASTDGSLEAAQASGVSIQLVRANLKNAAAVRNLGIQRASGAFIAFLDADDWWLQNHLEVARSTLSKGATAFIGNFRLNTPSMPERTWVPLSNCQSLTVLDDQHLVRACTSLNSSWPTSGMVISTTRLRDIGGFDETLKRRHDMELFVRAAYGVGWGYSEIPTWVYRFQRPGSISGNRMECAIYIYRAFDRLYHYFGAEQLDQRASRELRVALGLAGRKGNAEAIRALLRESNGRLPWNHWLTNKLTAMMPKTGARLLQLKDRLTQHVKPLLGDW